MWDLRAKKWSFSLLPSSVALSDKHFLFREGEMGERIQIGDLKPPSPVASESYKCILVSNMEWEMGQKSGKAQNTLCSWIEKDRGIPEISDEPAWGGFGAPNRPKACLLFSFFGVNTLSCTSDQAWGLGSVCP